MRRIFVGDIQGCLEPLDRLLRALELRSDDRVCCVGDLVNKGPDSLGVLRRVREIGAQSVLGNHDLALLRAAAAPGRGVPTELKAVLDAPDVAELLDWVSRLPVLLVEDDVVVVHAGVHPIWTDLPTVAEVLNRAVPQHLNGAFNPQIAFATEVRHCDAFGRRPTHDDPPPGPPFKPWDHWTRGTRTVVFGHWARRGLVTGARVRGLDTGCVYGGKLTAWIAEEDRFVQVPGLTAPATN
jgi:bis(5'-nucleosyl)-tetraphosphatase (symmetrical)